MAKRWPRLREQRAGPLAPSDEEACSRLPVRGVDETAASVIRQDVLVILSLKLGLMALLLLGQRFEQRLGLASKL